MSSTRREQSPAPRTASGIPLVNTHSRNAEEGDEPASETALENDGVPGVEQIKDRQISLTAQRTRPRPVSIPLWLCLAIVFGIAAVGMGLVLVGLEASVGPQGELPDPAGGFPLYDMLSVKAPRFTGVALKIFSRLVHSPVLGYLILSFLLKDNNYVSVRKLAASLKVDPTYHPVVPPTAQQVESATANTTLKQIPKEEVLLTLKSPGVHWSALDYARAYRKGTLSPLDVAKAFIEKHVASDAGIPPLKAVSQVDRSDVLAQAKASAERYEKRAPLGLLDGVPVLIKEELDVKGYATYQGTTFLGDPKRPADRDARPVARLREAGALILGTTTMHEIGIGTTGHNPWYKGGPPRNPYNVSHYPGGSSSGSAAAVAAGLVPLAVGADGGGSIRIPSSLTGIVGLKATFSRIPVHDDIAPSCAHVGPMGWSVADVALGYLAMAGAPSDISSASVAEIAGSSQPKPHISGLLSKELKGLRVGIDWVYFRDADSKVVATCVNALKKLKTMGVTLKNVSLAHLNTMTKAHDIIITSEMAQNFDRVHAEHSLDFAPESLINLHIGRHWSSRDFLSALKVRSFAVQQFQRLFANVDLIVTPTTGMPAPHMAPDAIPWGESNVVNTKALARFIFTGNFAGYPALTVPVGYVQGLPVGLQLSAPWWQEHVLLQAGHALEQHITRLKPTLVFGSYPASPV